MSSQDIKSYAVNSLKRGLDESSVKEALSSAGWPEGEIDKIFKDNEIRALIVEKEVPKENRLKEITAEIVSEKDEDPPKKKKTRPSSEDITYLEKSEPSQAGEDPHKELAEANSQLKEYLIENLNKGFDPSLMRVAVAEAGWPEKEIERVFDDEDVKRIIRSLSGEEEALPTEDADPDREKEKPAEPSSQKGSGSFVVPFVHRSDSELKNYVINEIKKGVSRLSIKAAAIEAGWPEKEVDKVFEDKDVKNETSTQTDEPQPPAKKQKPKKKEVNEDNFLDEFINPAGYKSQTSVASGDVSANKTAERNPFFDIFVGSSETEEESEIEEGEAGPQEISEEDVVEAEGDVASEEIPEEPGPIRDPYLELKNYIINEMKRGVSRLAIKIEAVDAGWPGDDVDKIFNEKELKDLLPKRYNLNNED